MVRMIQKNDSYIAVFEHVTPKEMELIRQIENLEKEEEKPVHQITIEEALSDKTNVPAEPENKVTETSEERPAHRPFVFKRREPRPEKSTDSADLKEGAQSAPFVFKRRDEKTVCSEEKSSVVKEKDQTPDVKVEEHKENASVGPSKDDELPDWCAVSKRC